MRKFAKVEIFPRLIEVWLGLLGTGYDLFDQTSVTLKNFAKAATTIIHSHDEIEKYFKSARTNRGVNPYWPLGSCLTTASFFITQDLTEIDLPSYLEAEKQNQASMVWLDNDFRIWIKRLPQMLWELRQLSGFSKLFQEAEKYTKSMAAIQGQQLTENIAKYSAFSFLAKGFEILSFVPNPFQAPELTDVVRKDGCLFVISNTPRVDSLVHETLHGLINPEVMGLTKAQTRQILSRMDLTKLQHLGYEWKDSDSLHLRAIEESLVRLVTLLIVGGQEPDLPAFQQLFELGFYVPSTLTAIRDFSSIESIIEALLPHP